MPGGLLLVNHYPCVDSRVTFLNMTALFLALCYCHVNARVNPFLNLFPLFLFLRMSFGCLKIWAAPGKSSTTWCAWPNGETGAAVFFFFLTPVVRCHCE